MIRFLRFMKTPILRTRFTDTIRYMYTEQSNGYDTNKTQEDLLFLDDIKRFVLKEFAESRLESEFS